MQPGRNQIPQVDSIIEVAIVDLPLSAPFAVRRAGWAFIIKHNPALASLVRRVAKAAQVEVKSCCALVAAQVSAIFARALRHPRREWNDIGQVNPTR